jgi:hypothetical protein
MAGDKTAQNLSGGIASNPANGITNLPLNTQGDSSGVTPEEILKLLNEFMQADSLSVMEFKVRFEDVLTRLTRDDMVDSVQKIIKAIDMAQDPRKRTKDPNTGQYDPTAKELAQRLADKVKTMNDNSNQKTSQTATFNWREAQAKPKKKTRGNPFRVLMGKVGKLLDHGLEKRDITRYLLKQKMWGEETIERAIDIVRDYNKKKRRDDPDGDKAEKSDKKAFVMPEKLAERVAHRLASMTDEEFDKMIQTRMSQKADNKEESVYEVKPEFSKRSTSELMARATWLMSLKEYGKDTPQGDGKKAADSKGVTAELKSIRKALEDRGFDADELATLGIK